ncbi:D-alanyl-D-alanine carboxypeptidase/D-alanyl-D-alanine endopeptidase [Streptomyces litchfieldiae]|uniref:D-alanyl-D-alanine carboxypeptidase/D-alanyl-D-alanine-endopeptidase n=1 Tax=Streptomyces litchfieldiae TaxID=3075543 RepID=A0ABU2MW61_9ACTN|nr:D-alanyl-D-alanine carboxypeptidase/D-alanyl-D-alanine-endopeptidase [Streptomyces sp. DSM 44938]MDT0345329.1 D-alanyl-D-alanine carboxypeptidase/D-alanyl-D-alanine-endopeptidase [Streptomyces sp. DSM 44938]
MTSQAQAVAPAGLEASIHEITGRPEFSNARWGMRFHAVDTGESLYERNPDQPFIAASAAKVFTQGTVFDSLGPDHRFRTRVYRTGPVAGAVLAGDLVIVASGDLVLGGRIQADGTVAAPIPDHSYGSGPPAPGDPLEVIRQLSRQVAEHGIRRVTGRVRVDASLFREGREDIGVGGRRIPVSAMMINDNIIDVTVSPGATAGAPAVVRTSPDTGYLTLVNEVRTVAARAQAATPLAFTEDVENADGTRTVRLSGEVPLADGPPRSAFLSYYVPEPVRFAQIVFAEALREAGVSVEPGERDAASDAPPTRPRDLVAEHVSPPVSEQAKVMLQAGSNIHTVTFPYLVGSIAGGEREHPRQVYEEFRSRLFAQAGVDPDVGDDPGYTPDFFTTFLAHMAAREFFPAYRAALPVLGEEGALEDIEADSPAAGHVHAKTGGSTARDDRTPVSKALAGFIELPDRRLIAFAEFVELTGASAEVLEQARHALGEIVTAVYVSCGQEAGSR